MRASGRSNRDIYAKLPREREIPDNYIFNQRMSDQQRLSFNKQAISKLFHSFIHLF